MDYRGRTNGRIYWQYRNAPKLREWLYTVVDSAQSDVEDPSFIVDRILAIDEREGRNLDVIGRIVGINRPRVQVVDDENISVFGAQQMGDEQAQFNPVVFYGQQKSSDALYRVLIKAKIIRNNGAATIDSIADALKLASGVNSVKVIDFQDMTFEVVFGEILSGQARYAISELDVVPRPQGVDFIGFIEEPSLTQMGGEQMGDELAQFNKVFS